MKNQQANTIGGSEMTPQLLQPASPSLSLGLCIVTGLQKVESLPPVEPLSLDTHQSFPRSAASFSMARELAQFFSEEVTADRYNGPSPSRLDRLIIASNTLQAWVVASRCALGGEPTNRQLLTLAKRHVRVADLMAARGQMDAAAVHYEETARVLERVRPFDGDPAWALSRAFFLERAGDIWRAYGAADRATDNFVMSAMAYVRHGSPLTFLSMDREPATIRVYLKTAGFLRKSAVEQDRKDDGLLLFELYKAMQDIGADMINGQEARRNGNFQGAANAYESAGDRAYDAGRKALPQDPKRAQLAKLWDFDSAMSDAYYEVVKNILIDAPPTEESGINPVVSILSIAESFYKDGRRIPPVLARTIELVEEAVARSPAESLSDSNNERLRAALARLSISIERARVPQ